MKFHPITNLHNHGAVIITTLFMERSPGISEFSSMWSHLACRTLNTYLLHQCENQGTGRLSHFLKITLKSGQC